MEEREMRKDSAAAYLLMTAERHLPCRESNECKASRGKIPAHAGHEARLVPDMLQDIMAYYQVESRLELLDTENIRCYEFTFGTRFGKKGLRIGNLVCRKVDSCHIAPNPREREKISSLAAAYFKNIHPGLYPHEVGQVRDEISFACAGKLTEIPCAVSLSFLHR